MRVYVPATLASVGVLLADGALPVDVATAVTSDLRAALPTSVDEEELELEALLDAAELSLDLVAADPSVPRRRVVLAADVADDAVIPAPEHGPAAVRLGEAVALRSVASAHVDEPGVDAQVDAGQVDDLDLLWYAPEEFPGLVPRVPG